MGVSLLSLPNELIEHIVDNLAHDPTALKVCSTINRRLIYPAQKHLFHEVTLRPEGSIKGLDHIGNAFLSFFEEPSHNHLVCLVKHLRVKSFYNWGEGYGRLDPDDLGQPYPVFPRVSQLLGNIEEITIPVTFIESIRDFRADETIAVTLQDDWKSSLVSLLQKPDLQYIRVEHDVIFRNTDLDVCDLISVFFASVPCRHPKLRVGIENHRKTEFSFRQSQERTGTGTRSEVDLGPESRSHELDLVGLTTTFSSDRVFRALSAVPFVNVSQLQTLYLTPPIVPMTHHRPWLESSLQGFLNTYGKSVQYLTLNFDRGSMSYLYADTILSLKGCTALKRLVWNRSIDHDRLREWRVNGSLDAPNSSYLLFIAKSLRTLPFSGSGLGSSQSSQSSLIERLTLDIDHHGDGAGDGAGATTSTSTSSEFQFGCNSDMYIDIDNEAWKMLDEHFSSKARFPYLREFRIVQRFPDPTTSEDLGQGHEDVTSSTNTQAPAPPLSQDHVVDKLKERLCLMNKRGILKTEVMIKERQMAIDVPVHRVSWFFNGR
ncbi:hypothetical protein D9758_005610 [Tetrapyrgos nigripes]|uniref:F-box domain-containing protein n=1 Tax=Tetrapyrgos nigripes TaxID=182062 RepID=A0A8H5GGJ3_9AGAR|nr:hypothetical protein D9758_005610 [Tetrapyrgos nigripes]